MTDSKQKLENCTRKALLEMAHERGLRGVSLMTKSELIIALESAVPARKSRERQLVERQPVAVKETRKINGRDARRPYQTAAARDTSVSRKPNRAAESSQAIKGSHPRDRIVCMVRDPFWLHCYWEMTQQSVERAEVSLGQDWHGAKPALRILEVGGQDTTSAAESVIRYIEIHGGCNNWYVDVSHPQRSYRVDLGFLTKRNRFFVLLRSNVVTTPKPGVSDNVDENWAGFDQLQADRIYTMSNGNEAHGQNRELKKLLEERLHRPLDQPKIPSLGSGAHTAGKVKPFFFKLGAELIVFGNTDPDAKVTLQGEPIRLRPDGTFTMRFSLPDSRQIIPAVAKSADGIEERTIVLAIERNTKELEPMIHDGNE